ncbi:MAG: hypothetical protein JWR58_660 [Pseudonocardia sp.]|nr:hypothetical protein [Pseudonocardia sp.]
MQTDGATLHVLVSKQTTVEIRIARPITVALPRDRTAEITTVRLYADDSAGLVAVVRASGGAAADSEVAPLLLLSLDRLEEGLEVALAEAE